MRQQLCSMNLLYRACCVEIECISIQRQHVTCDILVIYPFPSHPGYFLRVWYLTTIMHSNVCLNGDIAFPVFSSKLFLRVRYLTTIIHSNVCLNGDIAFPVFSSKLFLRVQYLV